MDTITHSKIQDLIEKLPQDKLPIAYNFLIDLSKKRLAEVSEKSNFMLLPLEERRRIMEQQAAAMIEYSMSLS